MFHDRRPRDRDLRDLGPQVENEVHRRYGKRGRFHSLVIGALIATFGITLLATNLGWTDIRSVMRQFWPFALVVLGLLNLFNERSGAKFWGLVMIVGGLFGSFAGAALFRLLQATGQIDLVIGSLYVLILGWIGVLMLKDALIALGYVTVPASQKPAQRHNRWVGSLPLRWRFYSSGLYLSPLAPLALGFIAGMLTVLLGIGGGFILVPAMIYLLGMPTRVVIGTSLFMILAVSAATTMVHSVTTQAVDIVLAALLLVGGVVGAQYGAALTTRVKPDLLRFALAIIILLVALRMVLGLTWRPDEIFSVEYL